MIRVRNLSKKYGDKVALLPVSFELAKGQTLSIVGLSGCGKSTLLKCLAGLVDKFEGEIEIAGMSHREYLTEHRVAMIFQRYSNFEWLSVFNNLKEAFSASSGLLQIDQLCEGMLQSLGLQNWSHAYPSELSGGMAQRVALGRALLQDQDLIGLDEPFAALDLKHRMAMQDLVRLTFREQKRTAIFVTHDIAEAIYVGDKILLLPSNPSSNIRLFVPEFEIDGQISKTKPEFLFMQRNIENMLLSF